MKTFPLIFALLIIVAGAFSLVAVQRRIAMADGYVIKHDSEVAKDEPGPHKGTGRSTGYVYFDDVPDFKFSFRKRVLHKGASIGYHLQETDEVYYITGGTGLMTINDHEFPIKSGDAVLTRKGSSHGLAQTGDADLTIIITYEKQVKN